MAGSWLAMPFTASQELAYDTTMAEHSILSNSGAVAQQAACIVKDHESQACDHCIVEYDSDTRSPDNSFHNPVICLSSGQCHHAIFRPA